MAKQTARCDRVLRARARALTGVRKSYETRGILGLEVLDGVLRSHVGVVVAAKISEHGCVARFPRPRKVDRFAISEQWNAT